MGRKKRHIAETLATTVLEDESQLPIISSTVEKDPNFTSLRARLAEINQIEGVTGYIIRNATSAAIDLKDPSNLMALALLSSHAADAGQEFSETFNLGQVENILIEGTTAKVLCAKIGKNNVNVFMEKTADHNQILKQICTDLDQ